MIAVGIVVATGCWLPETAWGQARTATSGIDAYGYSIFDQGDAECGYQFVDIAGSGTPVTLTASGADPARDDGGAVIALNDSFEFYGVLLTSLVLSSNGYLRASSSLAQEDGGDLSNDPYLPAIPGNGSATVARLLAFHDELSGEAAGGNTRAEYFAVCPRPSGVVAGEACTVIQWSGWGFLALPGTFDFQATLYHTSHAIVFQIDLGALAHSGATIGIQNAWATSAAQYHPTAALTGTTAVCFFDKRFPAGGLEADLAITKTDKTATLVGATESVYEIVVRNIGPSPVAGVMVSDPIPTGLENCNWTCAVSAGSSCTSTGSGDIADSADILTDGWVAYTLTCDIAAGAAGTIVNIASVSAPPGVTDPNAVNNSSTNSAPVPVELSRFTIDP